MHGRLRKLERRLGRRPVDPDAIFAARQALAAGDQAALARLPRRAVEAAQDIDELVAAMEASVVAGPGSPGASST